MIYTYMYCTYCESFRALSHTRLRRSLVLWFQQKCSNRILLSERVSFNYVCVRIFKHWFYYICVCARWRDETRIVLLLVWVTTLFVLLNSFHFTSLVSAVLPLWWCALVWLFMSLLLMFPVHSLLWSQWSKNFETHLQLLTYTKYNARPHDPSSGGRSTTKCESGKVLSCCLATARAPSQWVTTRRGWPHSAQRFNVDE